MRKQYHRLGFVLSDALIGLVIVCVACLVYGQAHHMMIQQTIVNRQAVEILRQRVEKQWQRQPLSPKKSKRQQKELKKASR